MLYSTLFRLSGLAAVCCALLRVINTARVAGVLPDTAPLRAIAPLASLAGMFALTGICLWRYQVAGVLGFVGYAHTVVVS